MMMRKIVLLIVLLSIGIPSYALTLKYTIEGELAGVTQNYLIRAREAYQKNDHLTLSKFKKNFLVTILKPDVEVEILDEDKEKNLVRFKIVDTDVILWTSIGALKNEPTSKLPPS